MVGPDSGCDSLSFTYRTPCDVYKFMRHENANLLKYSLVKVSFLLFTT